MIRKLINRLAWWLPSVVIGVHLFLLAISLLHTSYFTDDSFQYLTLSHNMWENGVFSQSANAPIIQDLQRTPGYSFFLMVLSNSPMMVLIVQHILVLLTGFLVFKTLRNFTVSRGAAAGAWLFLLMPYPAVFASLILSETLFLFLLIASVWLLSRYYFRGLRVTDILLAVAALALAVYVRPVAMPLIAFLLAVAFWGARKLPAFSLSLRVVFPLLLFSGMILPWCMRNYSISGRFTFSTMGDMGIVQGRAGGMLMMQQGLPMDDHHLFMAADSLIASEIGLAHIREYYSTSQSHETELLSREAVAVARHYIFSHPIDFLFFTGKSFYQMFSGVCYGWSLQVTGSKLIAILVAGFSAIVTLLIYFSLLASLVQWRRWNAIQFFALASLCVMLFLSAAAWADGRYRFPCDVLALIAAIPVLAKEKPEPTDSK
jgi:4-amino-4-deoxy-L-arabinose transferase-like glycosyltransferase